MSQERDDDDDNDDDVVQYVKLVSAEGYEFFLDRSIAIASSTTIRTMLSGSFLEGKENVIRLPDMAGYILERLVRYMHYKAVYSNSSSRIPEFVSILWLSFVTFLSFLLKVSLVFFLSSALLLHYFIGHRT
jgi:elongin-C